MIDAIRAVLYRYDDLGHMFEASLMLGVMAPLLVLAWWNLTRHAFWIYPVFVFAWYYGREKAQHELALKQARHMRSVVPLWNEGWWPGEWSTDGLLDLAVPSLYAVAWAIVLTLVFRRLFSGRVPARRG